MPGAVGRHRGLALLGLGRASSSSSSAPAPAAPAPPVPVGQTLLSQRRLAEFLKAEVTHFAAMPRGVLSLQDLLRNSGSPVTAARTVHQEIPKRFASRIVQIEELPHWGDDVNLAELHRRYSDSFCEMRLSEVGEDLSEFTAVVRGLKQRQGGALRLIGQWLHSRRQSGENQDREFCNSWVNVFLRSRLATEMLTSQYLAIINQMEQGQDPVTGIVDRRCDPAVICEKAAKVAADQCMLQLGLRPKINIEVRSKTSASFSYIPFYLHYLLTEVLTGSCKATALSALASTSPDGVLDARPIHVVICSDDYRVAVRIRDLAGNVPFQQVPSLGGSHSWDCFQSGSNLQLLYHVSDIASPTSGYGLGLPQARLYAEYLGGHLSVQFLPRYGTDVHLFLRRIDVAPFMPGSANAAPVVCSG